MSAFRKRGSKDDEASVPNLPPPSDSQKPPGFAVPHPIPARSELVFHCQLAHGSQTRELRDFSSVKELYARIAVAFDLSLEDVRFCNTNPVMLRVGGDARVSCKITSNEIKVMDIEHFRNWSAGPSISCIVCHSCRQQIRVCDVYTGWSLN